MFVPIEIGLMILSSTVLIVFAPLLSGIFSNSTEVISLSAKMLRMVALSEPFYG